MNILIVSYEAWRDTNNGGNVLSNIFRAFPDAKIAQLYCSGELPQNSVCRSYFQISDSMLLSSPKGRALEERDYSMDETGTANVTENRVKNRVPSLLKEPVLLARELLWTVFRWKTPELENFIRDFKPDVIFAPCYSYFHVSKLALHAKKIAGCPMISYISDDNYSLKQLRFSPSFWINRLITRKWIRRHFAACSLVYTMTDMQKEEYEAKLKRPMRVLCKSAEFTPREKDTGSPVRFIYAGGLYLNRWKVLAKLSEAIRELNRDRTVAELHIYSGSQLKKRQTDRLHDGTHSFLHGAIPFSELTERYRESDVAIHAESFDLKNRLITRLSFSTKIIDCMNSGCAILAVGPSSQAGIAYLADHDAAVCVGDLKELPLAVRHMVEDPDVIPGYAARATRLGKENHDRCRIEEELRQDFARIAAKVP
jgi:hypothetical protein